AAHPGRNHRAPGPQTPATETTFSSGPPLMTLEGSSGGDRSGRSSSADGLFPGDLREPSGSQRITWPDQAALVEGDTFAGYEIMKELGRGGMGVVYKARHARMNRVVALKLIHKEHLTRPSAIQRFYREIQAAAQLNHRNIVQAYDAGQFSTTHFFA